MDNLDPHTMDPTTANPMECIMALAESLGVRQLSKTHAGQLWTHKVDEQWTFAVNANREPVKTVDGVPVDPFHVYVEFNGWPAAVISPTGDGVFAAGTAANVTAFNVAVLKAAQARKEQGK